MGKKGTCSICRCVQTLDNSGTRVIKGKTYFLANCRNCDRIRMNKLNMRSRPTSRLSQQLKSHLEMVDLLTAELQRREDERI